jgi:hypothetical protein
LLDSSSSLKVALLEQWVRRQSPKANPPDASSSRKQLALRKLQGAWRGLGRRAVGRPNTHVFIKPSGNLACRELEVQ